MSRGAHLTPCEADRIRRLAATGMPRNMIARTVNRSRNLVWRVLTGRRISQPVMLERHDCKPLHQVALATRNDIRLETRIASLGVEQEVPPMKSAARSFIDTLAEHFQGGRKPSERALADLERELVADGYTVEVLDRAARDMLRTRYARCFPSVAECLSACIVAHEQLSAGAAAAKNADSEKEAA